MDILKLKYTLKALLRPTCWIRMYPYSKAWDAFIWENLKAGNVTQLSEFRADVGGKMVWIANFPYSSGHAYDHSGNAQCSRATALYLQEKLVEKGLEDVI